MLNPTPRRPTKRGRRTLVRTVVLVPMLAACGELLGIEDAHVDPRLSTGGAAPSGGAPSAGTSGASLGGAPAGVAGADGMAGASAGEGGSPEALGGSAGVAGVPGEGGRDSGATLCEQYCSVVTEYCAGPQVQYGDTAQCLRVCSFFPEGTVGAADDNSVACRLKYASKARYAGGVELAAYCRQAGPGGDDRCGSNCEGFCTVMMATCTSELEAPSFASLSQCLATCETLPQIPYVWGDASVADGNTVQCRTFHVLYAAMMDTEEHCEHAYGLTLCEAE